MVRVSLKQARAAQGRSNAVVEGGEKVSVRRWGLPCLLCHNCDTYINKQIHSFVILHTSRVHLNPFLEQLQASQERKVFLLIKIEDGRRGRSRPYYYTTTAFSFCWILVVYMEFLGPANLLDKNCIWPPNNTHSSAGRGLGYVLFSWQILKTMTSFAGDIVSW